MTVIDAYALVAFVADEPAADEVESLLRTGECRVNAINLAEAIDVCRRVHGLLHDDIRGVVEPLTVSNTLGVGVSDEHDAWLAAELRSEHYDRKTCAISIADCFAVALAVAEDSAIATADPGMAAVARQEGVPLVALPDRRGKRP